VIPLVIFLWFVIFLFTVFPVHCCCAGEAKEGGMTTTVLPDAAMGSIERQWPGSSQLIVVQNDAASPQGAALKAFEKRGGTWKPVLGPVRAMIGRNGFASAVDKREGDGRTPMGAFSLGIVFGYGSGVSSKMPYKKMTSEDIWVDDPDSPDYNRLTKKGETAARSFEYMVLPDHRYKYGIVVEYNTNPVVAGRGSAIFIHVWKDENTNTSGCVALSEENILKLIGWLDPAKSPLVSLGN